jgi:hypothetical protein
MMFLSEIIIIYFNENIMKEITVDGTIYVQKSESVKNNEGLQYCMVRTYSAGVFCGWIDPTATKEGRNTVKEAKRIHYWEKAASLSELAQRGTNNPNNCRVPMAVSIVYLENIIEVIPMTESAIKTIESIPVWTC